MISKAPLLRKITDSKKKLSTRSSSAKQIRKKSAKPKTLQINFNSTLNRPLAFALMDKAQIEQNIIMLKAAVERMQLKKVHRTNNQECKPPSKPLKQTPNKLSRHQSERAVFENAQDA